MEMMVQVGRMEVHWKCLVSLGLWQRRS